MAETVAVRAKHLKALLEQAGDEDVLLFRIFSEDGDDAPRFCSDVADASTLQGVRKFALQTSAGDCNVFRVDLVLDLNLVD
ncbi:hypothetical protein [Pseudomonas sp. Leaf58]|uniref:hypothetical protein n=1 Tax=Pseudomonas sp. Leaf58 TaxID=1736226 RepID=UPI0012E79C42|nr:hypothetical protein [Pseudomonas sp. Leaf58]